ncbi:universal stress protein [Halobiforma nitratireducens]|uniref:UspA domain protein n=1 Tax=Halobiforma nitratireducens JCM 10879 TaxID=1227454 RepID=M0LT83_9EURY|nr:universal stress protein [Halobiforma nitratireducens]EMA35325.1 UspA domain protein [Halobiforma nitratireducens JCM 10879]
MSGFDTILYPADGSEGAGVALEKVRDLAETYDATVHVLHVVDTLHPAFGLGEDPNRESSPGMVGDPQGADTPMGGDRESPKEIRAEAEEYGENVVKDAVGRLPDIDTHGVVRSGTPHKIVLEYADANDIDLIVMGTHGRTGLERYLIGSLTEKVVRASDVPVLTVPVADAA